MNNFPSIVAEEPIIINIIVKPMIKPKVLYKAKSLFFDISSSVLVPVIYIIYAGTNGSIQGEKNDKNPAPNANGNDTSPKFMKHNSPFPNI